MRRLLVLFAIAGLVAVSCSSSDPSISGPHDEAAEMRPDLMILEPATVRPGDTIELFFPEETLRGIHFVLEVQEGDSWNLTYNLLSDWGEGRTPEAYAVDDSEEFSYPDIGIGGPGPDVVVIPDDVPAGPYRICTGNAGENFCASLSIEAA